MFFSAAPGTLKSRLEADSIDWDTVFREAHNEYVLPTLAHQIERFKLTAALPAEVQNVLATAESLNEERNRLLLSETVHAAKLLNQIGVKPVVLKGAAYLLAGVYAGCGSRYLYDLDLLVPTTQLSAAYKRLLEHGYSENDADNFAPVRHHLPGVSRPGLPTLEVHAQIALGICNRILPAPELVGDAQPLFMDGAELLIPSPTHLVAHLILHSQLAHPYKERIFPPLRALYDLLHLQRYFDSDIDWAHLSSMFRKAGRFGTLALHLKAAYETIGFKVPSDHISGADPELKAILAVGKVNLWLGLRWNRRRLLSRWPRLRFLDPVYVVMSLFSRRLRLLPRIFSNPRLSLAVFRSFVRRDFYRRLFSV